MGQLMQSGGGGLELLIPFLPGPEAALEDPDVSEIMTTARGTSGSRDGANSPPIPPRT